MADIRKRKGNNGTNYQVRYPSKSTKTGYAYATFDTLKEARAFTENLGSLKHIAGGRKVTVPEAVQIWLDTCEKIGRDGREKVEATTHVEYSRRGAIMMAYAWESGTNKTPMSGVCSAASHWAVTARDCYGIENPPDK